MQRYFLLLTRYLLKGIILKRNEVRNMGKFLVRRTATGFKFNLLAANGQPIAASEVYESKAACVKGIHSVQKYAAGAKFWDLTRESPAVTNPRFELFQDKSGDHRFRLRSRNGAIIAVSEAYSSRAACENGIESVRTNAPEAMIEEA